MPQKTITPEGLPIASYGKYLDFARSFQQANGRRVIPALVLNWLAVINKENPLVLEYAQKIATHFGVPDIDYLQAEASTAYMLLRTVLEDSFRSRHEKRENTLPRVTADTLDTIMQKVVADSKLDCLKTWTDLIRKENNYVVRWIDRVKNTPERYCIAGTYILLRTQGEKNKAKITR